MQTVEHTGSPAPKKRRSQDAQRPQLTLTDLAAMSGEVLAALYADGRAPETLAALDGHPRGRMLAVRGLERTPVAGWIRAFAAATAFPWGGKSFVAGDDQRGAGVNRVHLWGRHQLFPFHTHIGPSVLDSRPCVILDYDRPDNPALMRKIHDEVREVAPGLFLGPAMWKRAGGPLLVLWFALDTRTQAAAVGAA